MSAVDGSVLFSELAEIDDASERQAYVRSLSDDQLRALRREIPRWMRSAPSYELERLIQMLERGNHVGASMLEQRLRDRHGRLS